MRSYQTIFLLIVMLITVGSISPAYSQAKGVTPELRPGHSFIPGQLMVMVVDGPSYFRSPNNSDWQRIKQGQTIKHGESVRTTEHGYLILTWAAENMIMLKPFSGLRVMHSANGMAQLTLQLHNAEILVSARDSGLIELESRHGTLTVNHGEASIISNTNQEIIRSIKGQTAFRINGNVEPTLIPEHYSLQLNSDGSEQPMSMFDPAAEYESFKRFTRYLKRFDNLHQMHSIEVPYQIDSVKMNNIFISNMLQEENQFYILETADGKIPTRLHLQLKITPYPSPADRFELNLGKDLVYALREGRDGYHEVIFAPPSIPEFIMAIQKVDSLNRRVSVFKAGFVVENLRLREQKARQFCKELSDAFSRRDQVWLRTHVSRDYRDWQGNTWYDFFNMADDTLRRYRDVRLTLHPFSFEVRDGMTIVRLNYRLSALTGDWNFRFEDRGSETFSLRHEDGQLRLYSKVAGMFFNRMKVAVDLRQGVLRGRITDERTRRPVAGVSITIRGTSFKATSDSMGEYVIYNVPPGSYDLKFFKNGYGELTATRVTLKPAGEQF